MKISVVGCGYVGLVAAACFAKLGHGVTAIEADRGRIHEINNKRAPFFEEGLNDILETVHLKVSDDYSCIADSEIIFICVGTPVDENGTTLMNQVRDAASAIGRVLGNVGGYKVVCVKSSVPPGTTKDDIIPVLEEGGKRVGIDFGVCVCPEFLREGKAVYDFMNPARVVIGESEKEAGDKVASLYSVMKAPIVRTDLTTAEMIKTASNAFLATKISFINEVGNICKRIGIDVYKVAEAMGLDERIGGRFLDAGIGFGGSCLPKDLKALISSAQHAGYKPALLKEVSDLNDKQSLQLVELLKKHVNLRGACIGLLGLAFKPGTDDVRDSRAIKIVQRLLEEGAIVKAYDPMAVGNFRRLFPQIDYVSLDKIFDCESILIITEWEEFKHLDYRGKVVVDGRRILKAKEAEVYEGVCW